MTYIQENNTVKLGNISKLALHSSMIALAISAAPAQAQEAAEAAPVTSGFENEDEFKVRFRADTLVIEPVLNVALIDSLRSAVAGEQVQFQTYSNYPAFIEKSEIRIFESGSSPDAEPIVVLDVDSNGFANWKTPLDGPTALSYVYRAYGKDGKFDETKANELTIVSEQLTDTNDSRTKTGDTRNQDLSRPNFGKIDESSRRNIQLNGLMATVTGHTKADDVIRVSGQLVPANEDGFFAAQQVVPRENAAMEVVINRAGKEVKRVSQDFALPKDDWFIVGQGDVTIGTSFGSGPAKSVSGDPTSEGDFAIGRAAFYAKGVVNEDIRITASLDTGETLVKDLFSNLDRKDPRQLFRRLDSDQYYPTFGDDSTLVEDAPTQGRFYLRAEKDDSRLIIGNFSTAINGAELAQLDRGLFGALVDVNTGGVTSFGEKKTQLTAFASDPGTIPGRDEFRGTGGSLYFLKRQDLSVGSERIRVEIRDRDTGIVLETRNLYPQQDYDFDPFQGRVTLLRPLASVASDSNVVRDGSSAGNVPVLVVRYEYTPTVGDLSGYTIGGRATQWVGEKLRLGATAQRDTVEEADQTLFGADIMYRQTAGTYLKAEIAQTEGPGFGQSNSVDGGLNFTDFAAPGAVNQKADAYRFEAAANFAELAGKAGNMGTVSAFYEHFDAGFGSTGQLTAGDTDRWGVAANVPIGKSTNITADYNSLDSAAGKNSTGNLDISQKFAGNVTAKIGVRYEDRTPGTLFNSVQSGERVDAGIQIGYKSPTKNYEVYGFGQATISRDAGRQRNNRGGLGGKFQLSERISLDAEASMGTGGLGADVQLNHRLGDGSEAYLGYSLFSERNDLALEPQNLFSRGNNGTLTVGARKRFNDALSIHGEQRVGMGGTAPSLVRSFGVSYDPTEHLSFQGSFENGKIDDATTGLFRRTAVTFSAGYTKPGLRLGTGVEARVEKGNGRDQTVWLFRNNVDISVNPDWHMIGKLNFAVAENDSANVRAADFIEGVAGFAYRPVDNDRLNALMRFTYFEDLGPVGQVSGNGTIQNPKQISSIVSMDINYDLSEKLTVGGKYGYRHGKVSLSRDSDQFASSNAHLGVIRANYNVLKNWDILAEGRVLSVSSADDVRWGGLAAIYRHINENMKIGVGYSFSDFSDDLTDQSYSSNGVFLNLLGKF